MRPKHLAADDTNVLDVLIFLLEQFQKTEGVLPFAIALLQPTSPFTLSDHIDSCVHHLLENKLANSTQTVSEFPHNYHAYNQRIIADGSVAFQFSEERKKYYNKQEKPKFYIFGNLVVVRSTALLQRKEIFPIPSIPNVIPFHYALDLDGPEDLELAEWYLSQGKVKLPHMD
jgi:CMP-N-acetylneuraminic acid synthetase